MLEYWLLGLILVPGYIFAAIASAAVNSSFKKYAQVMSEKRVTAIQVARAMLNKNGLEHIQIVRVRGSLTDYYDHRNKQLALSDSVIESSSLAALGVAAHEVGHAVQYSKNYIPVKIRGILVPILNFANTLLWPIVIIGLVLGLADVNTTLGAALVWVGIGVFGLAVLFQLMTLPAEFDASKRAAKMLYDYSILSREETAKAKKVLSAAAMTYIAAFALSILSMLRFVLLILRRRR